MTAADRARAYARQLADVAAGRSEIAPARGDTRFTDPAWQHNPLYRRLGQAYLATANAITDAVDAADLDWKRSAQAKLAAGLLVSALAPTNTLIGNPAACRRAIDTRGASLVRGTRNLLTDARLGLRTPRQADTSQFRLGENIGATKGSVVFRNEVVELIQYAPSTPSVRTVPLLIVWSLINRFYILDLAPGRSFIEYAVSQGFTVFVTSWRNPAREHAGWNLDTYASALLEAMDAVRQITGSAQVGTMGLCAGGQLLAALIAVLAERGDDRIAYACFGVSQLDLSVPSPAGLALTRPPWLPTPASLARLATPSLVDGRDLAAMFSWLRPDELIWSYWVNNYLMGQDPPAFDILAWNADTTRLPGELQKQLLSLAENNALAYSGALSLLGSGVDLTQVAVDSYVIGAQTDHLVPWKGAYRTTQLLGGESTFVLSGGGHIQHLVNPPGNPKARYSTGPVTGPDPDAWLAVATTQQGTWWGHWADWVHARSGPRRKARSTVGSRQHPPIEAAPGSYVRQK
ncbi:MAG TPA: alpha/beta fold hydrolase [Streptosporangiaceae bacterium]|nr:alpha/beta fold hydrolase [Streptosporangiaceae bacterium]